MKKILSGAIVALCALAGAIGLKAQQMPVVPMDSAVVVGTLPNGLTYYIRHNAYPKGQADFYIAQKVGSVLEEDNQRGLAHFLEHMCFNGTKNFPGNSLVSWLESIGVKFGAHLNAYTGTDETVYNITNVPTARTEVTDSCLLILHDWANELLLDPEEIDKERSVIHEEWRSRSGGQMRIIEQVLPTIYPNSRYGHRMPIGTMEVIDNFPHQALRDYYEKWYRPDLQGIFIVGDIDVARTEAKVKEMFADIEMPANPAERTIFPVPDTPGTIYAIGKDKEQSNAMFFLMFKFEPMPREMRSTVGYLVYDYMISMIDAMLNNRFNEMMSNPATPFAVAQAGIDNYLFSNTMQALSAIGVAKTGDIRPALESVYREVLRAKRGGFTPGELQRARDSYMASLEQDYNNRATQETSALTNKYIRHFIDNTPAADISDIYQMMQMVTQMVDVNTINQLFGEMVTDDNRVLLVMLPDSESYSVPTEAELAETMKSVDAEQIEAFVDNAKTEPLIPELPAPGSIVSTETNDLWGATVWTLSNGVKVMVKQTGFKDDEIIFAAVAPQGMSRDAASSSVADFIAFEALGSRYGIGSYTSSDLEKYLAGKQVSINPAFGLYERNISGSTTPKDLPVLAEMLYGYFTSVNYDQTEFSATQSLYAGLLKNQSVSPEYIFQVDVQKAVYASPYKQALTVADIENATRDGILALAKAQLANAADYTFIFVGNVDLNTLRPLVEQYIATLPADPSTATAAVAESDPAFRMRSGDAVDTFSTKMENPQTYCAIIESATLPYDSRNAKLASIAGNILSTRLVKVVREEMGAVYSIGARGSMSSEVGMNANIQTVFPMNPDKKGEVLEVIKKEFAAMAENITDEELSKVKEYMVKDMTEKAERNGAWCGYMSVWAIVPGHPDLFTQAVETINSITAADVQNFVKKMNAQGNYRVIILDPEK